MKVKPASQRGSGMVLSLMMVVVLTMLGATVHRLATSVVRESVYELRSAQAQSIAEAGLEDALARLFDDPAWRTGFTAKAFAEGSYTVRLSTDTPPWITSTGYSKSIAVLGPAVRSVRAKARLDSVGGARGWAIRAQSSISVDRGRVVDTYDSLTDPTPGEGGADVRSNGTLPMPQAGQCPPARVLGKGYHGSGSPASACFQDGVQSTGTVTLAVYACPPGPNDNSKIFGVNRQTGQRYNPLNGNNLSAVRNQTAVMYPGVYCLNDVTLDRTGELEARNSTGTVTIYLSGAWDMDAPSTVTNVSQRPSLLRVYGINNEIYRFRSSNPIQMDLDAGQATVRLRGGVEFFGRIVGDQVDLDGNLHFDRQFAAVALPTRVDWEPGTWSLSFDRP